MSLEIKLDLIAMASESAAVAKREELQFLLGDNIE
jgi:hypothetical protein